MQNYPHSTPPSLPSTAAHSDIERHLYEEFENWQKCQSAIQDLLGECSHVLRNGRSRGMSVHLASLDQAHQKERLAFKSYQSAVEAYNTSLAQRSEYEI
ncbi:MAG: hypothetical protein DWQ07_06550 [Chloroflexi bacterium]|nr:MAG: hypothetical protein DWQ07_06550 [Chloroflexota bacterium]MBL1195910.1 hypothetical protein [Chloroflexota bacterium]NOH13203.1 hypothetical protein [Chloroflexota bacterium]